MLNTGGMIGTSSTQSGSGDVGHVIKKWCPNCGTKGDGNDPPCIATIMYAASIVYFLLCPAASIDHIDKAVHKSLYHFVIISFQSLEDDEQKGILEFYAQRATVEEDQKDQVESMWKSICWENGSEVTDGVLID
ncbi:hypothetical protein LQV05_004461 [Cryptococcus neoformans]|nr:hypothetical protein LQV05_004461 [Cryptococcus neoformans]